MPKQVSSLSVSLLFVTALIGIWRPAAAAAEEVNHFMLKKVEKFDLQPIKPLPKIDSDAIVGGHGEMIHVMPSLAEQKASMKKYEATLDATLKWTCENSTAARCLQESIAELKSAGCVPATDPDTLGERTPACKENAQKSRTFSCELKSLNCGSPWRPATIVKNNTADKKCGPAFETRAAGKLVGDVCKSKSVRGETVESGHFVTWSCSNPPFVDSEKCYESVAKRLEKVGCELKSTASYRDCGVTDMENGFILGRARRVSWKCKSETSGCRSSASGRCPKDYDAFGPIEGGALRDSPQYVCRARPGANLNPTKSTGTIGK